MGKSSLSHDAIVECTSEPGKPRRTGKGNVLGDGAIPVPATHQAKSEGVQVAGGNEDTAPRAYRRKAVIEKRLRSFHMLDDVEGSDEIEAAGNRGKIASDHLDALLSRPVAGRGVNLDTTTAV